MRKGGRRRLLSYKGNCVMKKRSAMQGVETDDKSSAVS